MRQLEEKQKLIHILWQPVINLQHAQDVVEQREVMLSIHIQMRLVLRQKHVISVVLPKEVHMAIVILMQHV